MEYKYEYIGRIYQYDKTTGIGFLRCDELPDPVFFQQSDLNLHERIKIPQPGLQVSFSLEYVLDHDTKQYRAKNIMEEFLVVPDLIVPEYKHTGDKLAPFCFLSKPDSDELVHVFTKDLAIGGLFKLWMYNFAHRLLEPGTIVTAYCIQKFDDQGKLLRPHAVYVEIQGEE